jgi:hypothetical protein
MTNNELTVRAVSSLSEHLKDPAIWPMLHTLILSRNKIKDEGLIELSTTLLKRVQDYTDVSDAMILHLAIADTRITDAGFKFCIKKLDNIF